MRHRCDIDATSVQRCHIVFNWAMASRRHMRIAAAQKAVVPSVGNERARVRRGAVGTGAKTAPGSHHSSNENPSSHVALA
jgi:hypothetical protein